MAYLFLIAALLTMLIQSFVVSTLIKGLVLSYVFMLLQLGKDSFAIFLRRLEVNVFPALLIFTLGFAAWQLLGQFGNALFPPSFVQLPARVLVSPEDPAQSLFRLSLLTQSLYLFTSVIFFLYLVNYLRLPGHVERILRLARLGVILFVAYGFLEFAGFLLAGRSLDFISNRITGVDSHFGTFQTISLGGVTIERMKSLAGEPSMFAFSVVPFFILAYYLKDRIRWLYLTAALLSTSTTALLGLALFGAIEAVAFRRFFKVALGVAVIFLIIVIAFPQAVGGFYDVTLKKLSLQDASGIDRYDNFSASVSFFLGADVWHQLFGHGFGYIRSTDGFSTLLVNTGAIGFLVFVFFFLYPVCRFRYDTPYRRGLASANIVIFVLIMISVPEFYYFHVWFFAALSWHEYFLIRKAVPSP